MKKFLAQCYIWLLLIVLYAPIVFIAVFSFTESKVLGNWTGFSTKLYSNLFTGDMQGSGSLMLAIENTLFIAIVAASISTVLGTIAAIGLHNMRGKAKQAITFMNNIPMLNPDIITGVSLFLLFVFLHISQGYATVILAHITFCTPYVVLSVLPKLTQMNPNIYEAALDLGATPFQALRKSASAYAQARHDLRLHPCVHYVIGRLCRDLLHKRNHWSRHALHLHLHRCQKGWSYSGAPSYDYNHVPWRAHPADRRKPQKGTRRKKCCKIT